MAPRGGLAECCRDPEHARWSCRGGLAEIRLDCDGRLPTDPQLVGATWTAVFAVKHWNDAGDCLEDACEAGALGTLTELCSEARALALPPCELALAPCRDPAEAEAPPERKLTCELPGSPLRDGLGVTRLLTLLVALALGIATYFFDESLGACCEAAGCCGARVSFADAGKRTDCSRGDRAGCRGDFAGP